VWALAVPSMSCHQFLYTRTPRRSEDEVRRELDYRRGNDRPLVESSSTQTHRSGCWKPSRESGPRDSFKLVILAGGDFAPLLPGRAPARVEDRVIVRENVNEGRRLSASGRSSGCFTSENESFF